mgnify:CR=1 FL=1
MAPYCLTGSQYLDVSPTSFLVLTNAALFRMQMKTINDKRDLRSSMSHFSSTGKAVYMFLVLLHKTLEKKEIIQKS